MFVLKFLKTIWETSTDLKIKIGKKTNDFYFLFLHMKIIGLKNLKKEGKTLHANNSRSKSWTKLQTNILLYNLNHDINIIQIKKINTNFCKKIFQSRQQHLYKVLIMLLKNLIHNKTLQSDLYVLFVLNL